jgi:hypothetical protein
LLRLFDFGATFGLAGILLRSVQSNTCGGLNA